MVSDIIKLIYLFYTCLSKFRVLHMIRNLLCISPLNTFGSTEKSQFANQLHRELLVVLQEEMVLDVLVCVGQEVERRENSGYNLLLMEILSCLLKGSDPSDVARWDDGMNSTGAAPSFSAPISIVGVALIISLMQTLLPSGQMIWPSFCD